jgi:hypothetical protein
MPLSREPWLDSEPVKAIGPIDADFGQSRGEFALTLIPTLLLIVNVLVATGVLLFGLVNARALWPGAVTGFDPTPVIVIGLALAVIVVCLVFARRQVVVRVLLGQHGIAFWRTTGSWVILWNDLLTWHVRMAGLDPGETWPGTSVVFARRDGQERTIPGSIAGIEKIQARIWEELLRRLDDRSSDR